MMYKRFRLPRRKKEPVIGHSFEASSIVWPLRAAAFLVRLYVHLVETTTKAVVAGDGPLNELQIEQQPIVLVFWHGRNFQAIPLGRIIFRPTYVLTSRSRDGAVIANIIKPFGLGAIQGSGTGAAANKTTNPRKRGAQAFRSMLKHLQTGGIVVMSADVPPGPVFETGPGMVKLAARAGAYIVPLGVCYRPELPVPGTWDRLYLPLPFGQRAFVFGDPIAVSTHADAAELAQTQKQIDHALMQAQEDAARLIGKRPLPWKRNVSR